MIIDLTYGGRARKLRSIRSLNPISFMAIYHDNSQSLLATDKNGFVFDRYPCALWIDTLKHPTKNIVLKTEGTFSVESINPPGSFFGNTYVHEFNEKFLTNSLVTGFSFSGEVIDLLSDSPLVSVSFDFSGDGKGSSVNVGFSKSDGLFGGSGFYFNVAFLVPIRCYLYQATIKSTDCVIKPNNLRLIKKDVDVL